MPLIQAIRLPLSFFRCFTVRMTLGAAAACLLVSPLHADVVVDPNSTGATDVTPDPTTILPTQTLSIGLVATGELLIDNTTDGNGLTSVTNAGGFMGVFVAGVGTATVTGATSTWTNSSILSVGRSGNGTLNIEAGGAVSNTQGFVGDQTGSTGTVTVTGVGSTWTNTGELRIGSNGFISGGGGDGTLNIEAGGTVSNTDGYIGFLSAAAIAGAGGTATVTGANSTWTHSGFLRIGSVFLGGGADGTLTIANGGAVTVAGSTQVNSTRGTLNLTGGTLSTGSFLSKISDLNWVSGTLAITGAGGLVIDGSAASGNAITLSNQQTLDATNGLTVGGATAGTLTVNAGATASTPNTLTVGNAGTVNLAGGTLATNLFDNTAGGTFNFISGTLHFTNGLTADAATTGDIFGNTPEITTGQTLQVTGTTTIPGGSLLVLNGGTWTTDTVAADPGAVVFNTGTFNLLGESLLVGGAGQFGQTLSLGQGMAVNVTNDAGNVAADGILSLGPTSSFSAVGGTNDGEISVIGGSLGYTNGATNNAGAQINAINATLDFGATSLTNTGQLNLINTTVNGVLTNNGSTAVSGTATFNGNVTGSANYTGGGTVVFNDTFAPGNSPAAVAFGGNYQMGSTSTLIVEVLGTSDGSASPIQFDQVNVTANASLAGTLDIQVDPGFTPVYGNAFTILTYGTRTGTFGTVTLNGSILALATDLALAPVYDFPGSADALFADTPFAAAPDTLTLFTTLPGDANLDLQVDDADLSLLLTNFGSTGAIWIEGDFTGDGLVDDADLSLLLTNFGGDVRSLFNSTGLSINVTTIPEPATLTLLSLGCLLLARRRAA